PKYRFGPKYRSGPKYRFGHGVPGRLGHGHRWCRRRRSRVGQHGRLRRSQGCQCVNRVRHQRLSGRRRLRHRFGQWC
ncbi:MAG: hypothetical protein M3N98_03400, partial [Actinomycetota bacterium]|nr:hypothetical protein [Actinomycetota bacterium]